MMCEFKSVRNIGRKILRTNENPFAQGRSIRKVAYKQTKATDTGFLSESVSGISSSLHSTVAGRQLTPGESGL